jgi:hypothetical protein
MKTCLQFEITHEEVDHLEQKIHAWVRLYEEYAFCTIVASYKLLIIVL